MVKRKIEKLRIEEIDFIESGDVIYVKGEDGVAYPTDAENYFPILRSRLRNGKCPNCDVPLIRGLGLKKLLVNWWNKQKHCPNCGFILVGE